jgi:hypothetical protein
MHGSRDVVALSPIIELETYVLVHPHVYGICRSRLYVCGWDYMKWKVKVK